MIKSWFQSNNKDAAPSWLPPSDISSPSQLRRSSESSSGLASPSPQGSAVGKKRFTKQENVFSSFKRSEAATSRQLQQLLDAQAEGLAAGIGQQPVSKDIGASSILYEPPIPRHGKVTPVRQPQHRPTSLRAARQGILHAMRDLADIKNGELETCAQEIARADSTRVKATEFEARHARISGDIETIRATEEKEQRERLEGENAALQEQITAMELQLARLRDEQNTVRSQLSTIKNAVDSKISSYNESTKLLESDISNLLRTRPTPSNGEHETYLSLPSKRRTLRMALDHSVEEKASLESRQKRLEAEKEALDEGQTVWQDTMKVVAQVEASLKKSIKGFDPTSSHSEQDLTQGMDHLLQDMDQVIEDLESKLHLAETRGWKLLVCCIGAELEAFRQGKDMLRGVSSSPRYEDYSHEFEEVESVESGMSPVLERSNQFDEPLRGSVSTIRRFKDQRQKQSSRSFQQGDEEPDPELLVAARPDTDTEPE